MLEQLHDLGQESPGELSGFLAMFVHRLSFVCAGKSPSDDRRGHPRALVQAGSTFDFSKDGTNFSHRTYHTRKTLNNQLCYLSRSDACWQWSVSFWHSCVLNATGHSSMLRPPRILFHDNSYILQGCTVEWTRQTSALSPSLLRFTLKFEDGLVRPSRMHAAG